MLNSKISLHTQKFCPRLRSTTTKFGREAKIPHLWVSDFGEPFEILLSEICPTPPFRGGGLLFMLLDFGLCVPFPCPNTHTWMICIELENRMHWLPCSRIGCGFLTDATNSPEITSATALSSMLIYACLTYDAPFACILPHSPVSMLELQHWEVITKIHRVCHTHAVSGRHTRFLCVQEARTRSILGFSETRISIQNFTWLSRPTARGIISREHKYLSVKHDLRIEHH